MDLTVKKDALSRDDQSWLGSAHGTSSAHPVTLDISTFTAGTHYPDGFLPSGTAVGILTGSGLAGPYLAGALDGTAVFAGLTLTGQRVSGPDAVVVAPLLEHGRVISANLPFQTGAGAVDAPAKTAAAGRLIFA